MKVLFTCWGNVCRSPMAEGMFRHKASLAGLPVDCDSAGVLPQYPGSPPDWRAVRVARQYHVNIADHRRRAVVPGDFTDAGLIVAMDQRGEQQLRFMAYSLARPVRIAQMLDFVPGRAGRSIRDPYSGNLSDFFDCWRTLEPAVDGLLAALKLELAA